MLLFSRLDNFWYFFFCEYWYRKATCNRWTNTVGCGATSSEKPNTAAMDQYCFLLTGSDWSQADMRFQDENSRCLLWRRMSSNRAVRPLMKPTGRQRQKPEPSLAHAPYVTRETQLKSLRLWMQQLLPLLLPWKSVTVLSRCFEMIFDWGFYFLFFLLSCQLLRNMPWPVLKWGSSSGLFWWFLGGCLRINLMFAC